LNGVTWWSALSLPRHCSLQGKSLISWYIGSNAVASSFGAAGALIVVLLWVYYSAQIFLLGAEFTKIYVNWHGSKEGDPLRKTVR
jgi:membrane protein